MKKQKVLVAMSGGVDSSVSAAILKEQGYEVEGAFIKTWAVPWLPCSWRDERRDAMRVAAHLHIPFCTIDLSKEYEKKVAEYFIEEYRKGNTPNPDVMCNKHIKFGGFFDYAMENGFDYVATGHYARIGRVEKDDKKYTLLKGMDSNKDQTYFLWTLTQQHVKHTLFPIGEYEKKDVRKLAHEYGLKIADKKDSQGVCFLGKINMKEFLSHYIETKEGDVLDVDRNVIGKHDGAVFLTLGQRHGFSVHQTSPESTPLYIVGKNVEDNTITVAPSNVKKKVNTLDIKLNDVNWISESIIEKSVSLSNYKLSVLARLRYRQKLFPATVCNISNTSCIVVPDTQQLYVSSGQSLVFYDGDNCLGGGVIE